MSDKSKKCPFTHLTTDFGAPVVDNQNSMTAGARGPLLAQDLWLNEKLANFVREVIPERRMHAKGSGAFGRVLSCEYPVLVKFAESVVLPLNHNDAVKYPS